MALLEVKNITKKAGENLIIDDISFNQQELKKIAIAGESGAGKTTLLKLISAHEQPTGGTIFFDGKRVIGPEEKLLPGHKEIAYLSQHYELLNNYRVEELIWFENKLSEKTATALFEICRISSLLKRKTNQLSGGEKQRIALCMLLIKQPKLLVLDEPFSNLDPIHTDILKAVLEDVTVKLKITCILTSHDPHDTLSSADEIIVIQKGKIIQQGTPETIYQQPVNEYVAGMFGKYNLLKPKHAAWFGIDAKNRMVMIRPEEFIINNAALKNGVKGIIQKINFGGSYYDAEVLVKDFKIIVRLLKNNWQVGKTIYLNTSHIEI